MKHLGPFVVVYPDGSTFHQSAPDGAVSPSGQRSGPKSDLEFMSVEKSGPKMGPSTVSDRHAAFGPQRDDGTFTAHEIAKDFPGRWSDYIRANFVSLAHVCEVFGVSEKAARNWWCGSVVPMVPMWRLPCSTTRRPPTICCLPHDVGQGAYWGRRTKVRTIVPYFVRRDA